MQTGIPNDQLMCQVYFGEISADIIKVRPGLAPAKADPEGRP
jgi:hypothetical protein